jgi:hypothetical protein
MPILAKETIFCPSFRKLMLWIVVLLLGVDVVIYKKIFSNIDFEPQKTFIGNCEILSFQRKVDIVI